MQLIWRILSSRISNKIILPYLLLALCLTIATTFVAVRLTAGTLQERMDNRLIEAGQVTSDGLVALEDRQIEQLRAIAFTEDVPRSFVQGDTDRLAELLRPHWANAGLFRLIAFDPAGELLISWQRDPGTRLDEIPTELPVPDLTSWWLVQQITSENSDAFGDKFSAFRDSYLYTAAPVRRGDELVGGIMVGMPLDLLLEDLQSQSQASVTTFYDEKGYAVATTQIVVGDTVIPAIPVEVLEQLVAQRTSADNLHIQDVVLLNEREYQFAYSPLQVRRVMNGYFAVALPRSFIVDTWAGERLPLIFMGILLMAAVVALGLIVSRRITRPLQELVTTAQAVSNGELQRRSSITSHDEIGLLANSFNQMTGRLLHLYETSRVLNTHSQISTILEQTTRALQPLVPGATALALLQDHDAWRFFLGDGADESLHAICQVPIRDEIAIRALAKRADRPMVAATDARRLRSFKLPPEIAAVCYSALVVQGRLIGLLLIIHEQPDVFTEALLEPLAAITSMAATALHNTQLYLEVQHEGNQRRAILESIADGVLVCDSEGRVLLMNPAAEELLDIHDWNRRRYAFAQLPLAPVTDSALHGPDQMRYTAPGGQIVRTSRAHIPAIDQDRSGEVIVLHNVSEEAALDQAKTDLIAMISHELRTPLTAINSATDMLRQGIGGPLTPLQQELTETAQRQSHAMSALIEKAVMVANIEMGSLDLDLSPTGIGPVLESALSSLRDAATAAEVELVVDIPNDLPLVMVDARMLKVAFQQLLDNAIKYGPGAPVRIIGRPHADGVAVGIRDFGPGIPPEVLPNLFQRLRRSADSLNAEPRGMGLGLVITRELIECQGGTISVESQPGEGCLFSLFLPGANNATNVRAA
jgi:signal transduction histidine kinase